MDEGLSGRVRDLLDELEKTGVIHFGDLAPLSRDPEAHMELDTVLARLESVNGKVLPDVEVRPSTGELPPETRGDEKALQIYLREVARVALLSLERETVLLHAAVDGLGDAQAKKELVEANLGFVASVAEDYQGSGLDMLDLIQSGNDGLIGAVDSFRIGQGYRFSTYAIVCAHQAIVDLISSEHVTEIPVHLK